LENKKEQMKVPHFPPKPCKALTCNKLEPFGLENGTKTSQESFGAKNIDFSSPKKKMHITLNSYTTTLVQHIPADLKENPSGWYIEYYCFNPFTEKMERIRYKVNKYRRQLQSDKIARREIRKLVLDLNIKLSSGWSPFMEKNPFNYANINSCIDEYLLIKKSELRFESLHHYTSMLSMFRKWLIENKIETMLPSDFNKSYATKYMNYVLCEKKVSNRTWNNYRGFLRAFFFWLIENSYCAKNPFAELKHKKNEEKNRDIILIEDRKRIAEYLLENHYSFLIFCLLEYSCLMRPIEIFRAKISDFDLEKQIVTLDGKQTKNHGRRKVVIPNNIIGELRNFFAATNVERFDPSYYLFSTDYVPGTVQKTTRYSGKTWAKIRTALKLPMKSKLYSLRDSSILDMLLSNMPAKVVQKHADHHDLKMTTLYANHESAIIDTEIRENSPDFY